MANIPWYKMSRTATKDFRFRCMTPKAQTLYLHLCRLRDHRDPMYWIQYPDDRLSFESGLSVSSVKRARYELEMNGFIKLISTRNRKATRYKIIDDPERGVVHRELFLGVEDDP
jgi:hypothetical protein